MLILSLILACSEPAAPPAAPPEGGAGPPPAPSGPAPAEAAAQAARAAPVQVAEWTGPWTPRVVAAGPVPPGAQALADTLGVPVEAPPAAPALPGQVVALWAPVDGRPPAVEPRGGARVAVLGPGSEESRKRVAAELPWQGLQVVDPTVSASLWTDPAPLSEATLGAVAALAMAEHFDLPWTPSTGPLPPGLAQALGPVDPADRSSPDPIVRTEALRRQGAGEAEGALLQDPQTAVRLALVDALQPWDMVPLCTLFDDPEPLVRARAALRCPNPAMLIRHVRDDSSVVRLASVQALASPSVDGEVFPGGPGLFQATASPDAYMRWKAAWWHRVRTPMANLLPDLLNDVDADVRRQAARSLGLQGDPAAVPALVLALRDENSFVRRWAAEALGRLGDVAAVPALVHQAGSPTKLEAEAAALALTALGHPTEAPRYEPPTPPRDEAQARALAADPDATTRKDLCKLLAGQPAWRELLRGLAADPDSEVRKAAVEALGWDPGAARDLLAALADPDPDVLVTALDGLRRTGAGDAPAVVAMLGHADAEVRLRATEALAAASPLSDVGRATLEPLAADPDERIRAAVVARIPEALPAAEPAILVRRAAAAHGRLLPGEADALVLAALPDADPALAAWARGVMAREDLLLHVLFSWNEPAEQAEVYRTLRPPVIRPYGHPDRG